VELYKKNGFSTDFFETEIESLIFKNYDFIKNVAVLFPKKFRVNKTDEIYYNMEQALMDNKLTMLEIIKFCPFYIYYNNDYITIDMKTI